MYGTLRKRGYLFVRFAATAPAVNGSPARAVPEAEAGDTSFLADVTMSEA